MYTLRKAMTKVLRSKDFKYITNEFRMIKGIKERFHTCIVVAPYLMLY